MYPVKSIVQVKTDEHGQSQFLTPNINVESSYKVDRNPRLLCILPEIYIYLFHCHLSN